MGTGSILRYDGTTGDFDTAFATGLSSPKYIAFDIVPEPSTLLLVGTGLVGLLTRRRRARETGGSIGAKA